MQFLGCHPPAVDFGVFSREGGKSGCKRFYVPHPRGRGRASAGCGAGASRGGARSRRVADGFLFGRWWGCVGAQHGRGCPAGLPCHGFPAVTASPRVDRWEVAMRAAGCRAGRGFAAAAAWHRVPRHIPARERRPRSPGAASSADAFQPPARRQDPAARPFLDIAAGAFPAGRIPGVGHASQAHAMAPVIQMAGEIASRATTVGRPAGGAIGEDLRLFGISWHLSIEAPTVSLQSPNINQRVCNCTISRLRCKRFKG